MAALAYQCRTIGNPQPFYYYPSKRKASWIYNSDYYLVDAPDGFYVDPPAPKYVESSDRNIRGSLLRTRTISLYKGSTACLSEVSERDNILFESFLEGNDAPSMSFMKNPFYPSDLFLLYDGPNIKAQFSTMIILSHWSLKDSSKKNPLKIEHVLSPVVKTLHGTILSDTPDDLANLVISLTKACRSFILHSDTTKIVDIINRLEGHPGLLPDVSVFLMSQTNSKQATQDIKNAWYLFTIIISRFSLSGSPKLLKLLRSYTTIVASSAAASDIRNIAMICLFRLSCKETPNIVYDPTAPLLFFSDCCSPKFLFGVSLGEVIYKERNLNAAAKSPTLVPFIVRKLVSKMRLLGAFRTREIFNQKSISRTEKIITIQRLNKGDWEIDITNVHTIAAILKHFLKKLQQPILTDEIVNQLSPQLESFKCIQLANSLPNEYNDMLMYVVGFLQELANYERETMMSAKRLASALSPVLVRSERLKGEDKLEVQRSLDRFLLCLINNWKTDEVYITDA